MTKSVDPTGLAPGQTLGPYRVEQLIGRGGMASVYLATDTRLGRHVAIKVLDPELSHSISTDRFSREVNVVANLSHPHILPLFETGEFQALRYYVTPYVKDRTLADLLERRGRLSEQEAVAIVRDVADALDYAHRLGVVHRDIKPGNILLTDGGALVADFGLASLTSDGAERLTQTGVVVGTPTYMSPEQLDGGAAIDGRSDQYSLACVLFEMLAGQPPFTAGTLQQLAVAHLTQQPALDQLAVSDQTRSSLRRALAKAPAERFATVREFAASLGRPASERSQARRRVPAMIVLVGVLSVAGGVLAYRYGTAPPVQGSQWVVATILPRGADQPLKELTDRTLTSVLGRLEGIAGLEIVAAAGPRGTTDSGEIRELGARLGAGRVVTLRVSDSDGGYLADVRISDGSSGAQQRATAFAVTRDHGASLSDSISDFLRQAAREQLLLKRLRQGNRNAAAWTAFEHAVLLLESPVGTEEMGRPAAEVADSADALLARAAADDPSWPAPRWRRIRLRFDRADPRDRNQYLGMLDSSIALLDTMAKVHPGDANVWALKGRLMLARHDALRDVRLDVAQDTTAVSEIMETLRHATALDPTNAEAWYWYSFAHNLRQDFAGAAIAAQRAYEADPLVRYAASIVSRLAVTYYDAQGWVESARWCNEGRRRFPNDARFDQCRLLLYHAPARAPAHPDSIWAVAGRLKRAASGRNRAYQIARADMLAGAALAHAGLRDSADRVMRRARDAAATHADSDLLGIEAAMREVVLQDREEALRLLAQYLAANPGHRAGFARSPSWWWTSLRTDPRYRRLVGLP